MTRAALPIDAHLDAVRHALTAARAAVVVAPPGAGKTTRVAPAVADAGRVVVLQPRRVAARAVARRIADEQGWTLGREVGWHVRFDRRSTDDTRVLVVTEGMLTRYLEDDPLLSGVATVILDEFHERSLHTDLGLALAADAWRARGDLRLVVMSATMDPAPVQAYLDGCPLIDVRAATHPLEVTYAPGETVAGILPAVLASGPGDVLCFLAGAGEIERAIEESRPHAARFDVDLLPLHGSLTAEAQDLALRPGARRRVVMATNIAETSLTVPGVSLVVDAGWQKVARYDADRAIDTLVRTRVTADGAAQRAGRAARLGPGRVWRLWDARDRLREAREPEVQRVDLAGVLLGVIAAGNAPHAFPWFEAPPAARVAAGLDLLAVLGALDGTTVTPLGHQLRRFSVHPRLARVLLAAGGAWQAAAACALLSEGWSSAPAAATTCDLLPLIDRWPTVPPHTRLVADALVRQARDVLGGAASERVDETGLRRALLAGYPDRVGRRRAQDRARLLLSSGRGAVVGRECGVADGEWLVALDVTGGRAGPAEAVVRAASRVEPEWLTPTARAVECRLDEAQGLVRAVEVSRYGELVVAERAVAADPGARARVLAAAWRSRPCDEATSQLVRRARFAGVELDLVGLSETAAAAAQRLGDIDIAGALPWEAKRAIDASAPLTLAVPSGRHARLDYRDDGAVVAAVKLQELFGLADTPVLGPHRRPVLFELLAPNGRPVQTTTDLRSFWARTYPDVRKELRGRYPRHPWPEDPWTAVPTHRTSRRS